MNPLPDPPDRLPWPPGLELVAWLVRRPDGGVARALRDGVPVAVRVETHGGEALVLELALLAQVEHPGLAALVDHGPLPGGGAWLAREWVEGTTFDTWCLGRTDREIGAQLARLAPALQHLHDAGFVHGDVKAANAVVGTDGRPRWIDFGMARSHGARAEAGGTPLHLAPERLLGLPAEAAADRFAFGAMLVERLVRRPVDVARFHARFPADDFWTAADLGPERLPEWARDLAQQLLHRDPDARPADLSRVADSLRARLGLRDAPGSGSARASFPPWSGREAARDALLDRPPGCTRVRPLASESGPDLVSRLRLEATLLGRTAWAVDLDPLQTAGDRERTQWARGWAERAGDGLLLVDATGAAPPHEELERSLEVLLRAAPGACVLWFDHRHPRPDVTLGPVPEAAVARRLEELVGPHPGLADLAARLHASSGGCPRALVQGLTAVLESDSVQRTPEGPRLRATALPDHLGRHAARTSSGADTDEERRLVRALHAMGGTATLQDLHDVAGLEPQALTSALARGLAAGRLRRRGARLELVASPPDTSFAQQRDLHRRLVERTPEGPLREVHRFLGDPDEQRLLQLRAALEGARRRGEAVRALQALDRLRALAPGQDPLLDLERALTLAVLGDPDGARRVLDAVPEDTEDELPTRALRLRVRARLARHGRRLDEALADLREAEQLEPELVGERVALEAERALALGDLASLARWVEGEPDPALPEDARWNLRLMHAVALARGGDVSGALTRLTALEGEAATDEDAERSELRAAIALNRAVLLRRDGEGDAARVAALRARDLRASRGDLAGEVQAEALLGALARDAGHWLAAEAHLTSVARARELLGDAAGAAEARASLALVAAERGHLAAALQGLERAEQELDPAVRAEELAWVGARRTELRVRLESGGPSADPDAQASARVLLCHGRQAWVRGDVDEARAIFERAAARPDARSGADGEARAWGELLAGGPVEIAGDAATPAERELRAVLRALAEEHADACSSLARELEGRGRDDRAARLWFAAARRGEGDESTRNRRTARGREALERCLAGLDPVGRRRAQEHLLGVPDPWPDDLAHEDEELEMDVMRVLEINQRLVEQQDLPALLGTIVEQALGLAGAERGFLVLEQDGRLSLDLAKDSRRGDLDDPELELSRTVVHEALDSGRTVCLADAGVDPLVGSAPSIQRLALRSVLCHPFDVDPGLRGVLYLDHRTRSGVFGSRVERALALLAGQAALAIRQVHRLQQIRRLNDDLARQVVDREHEALEARRELAAHGLVAPVAGLVGSGRAMRRVHGLLRKAAPSSLSVLVMGESGTGKELAARAVHDLSARRAGPFVAENCAALPASLVEAELFGHVPGAFTGADREAPGIFERADGGTLFLDEVGELPPEAQAKLLRVLETRRVRRLGDDHEREVDFRLVCATNRDLEREVQEGRFRQDLLYRLDGVRVEMPALRERPEDLPLLVDHFLRLEERRDGRARRCSPEVLERLLERPWPGNVRELANEVARLCVLSDGDLTDPELVRAGEGPAPVVPDGRPRPLLELERQAILQAIAYCDGDKREAAELLGISRAKVYQRLKEWRVEE